MKDQSNNYFKIVIGALALIFLTFVVYGAINVTQLTSIFTTTSNVNTTSETNFTHLTILANGSNAPYDNLVGYWSFDNDNSTTAYDFTNNNNDFTIIANSNTTNCIYYSCANLTKGSPTITGNLATAVNGASNFTFMGWMKTNGAVYPTSDQALIATLNNFANGYMMYFTGSGDIRLYVAGSNLAASTAYPNDGGWHHIVAIRDGTTGRIYVDNVAKTVSGSLNGTFTGDAVYLGKYPNSGSVLNALVDELMIFNTSLTAQQITDIYNNQSARFYPTGTTEPTQFNITY